MLRFPVNWIHIGPQQRVLGMTHKAYFPITQNYSTKNLTF